MEKRSRDGERRGPLVALRGHEAPSVVISRRGQVACVAKRSLLTCELEIVVYHHAHQLREAHSRLPAELLLRLAGIAAEVIDFGRPKVTRVDLDVSLPLQS